MTKTKTNNGTKEAATAVSIPVDGSESVAKEHQEATAVIEEATPQRPVLTLDDLKREMDRYQMTYDQHMANANATGGVIQWLSMQIERLESNNQMENEQ